MFLKILSLLLPASLILGCAGGPGPPPETLPREVARRHVNAGVAYLAQFLPGQAADQFGKALALDPDNLAARVNLGITARLSADMGAARAHLAAALDLDPDHPTALYNLALVERLAGDPERAAELLQRVRDLVPGDPSVRYNLAVVHAQLQRHADAIREFEATLSRDPTHASALYGKGRALLALGREEEAMAVLEASQELAAASFATTAGQQYGEQGALSLAIEDMPVDPVAPPAGTVRFADVTAESGLPHPSPPAEAGRGTGAALADLDGDGDLDLYAPGAQGDRLYLNDGHGRFTGSPAGPGEPGTATGVSVGDFDNDGDLDLHVGRWHRPDTLLRNDGAGRFEDVTGKAGVGHPGATLGVAFADLDHDGDLDLLAADAAPDRPGLLAYRNDGGGVFHERAAESGLGAPFAASGILVLDIDRDRDVDIVVVGEGGARLHLNNRDWTFQDASEAWGLPGDAPFHAVTSIDLGKDGDPDLVLTGPAGSGIVLRNDGWRLAATDLPRLRAAGAFGSAVLDLDLDGFADLAVLQDELTLYRNTGRDGLQPLPEGGLPLPSGRALLAGDLDADGDLDLVARLDGGGFRVLRNDGDGGGWLALELQGRHSNRSGIGARVALRAGDLWDQRLVSSSGGYLGSGPLQVHFGLGRRRQVDGVSILWPGGVLQDELEVSPGRTNRVQELDRKGSSCPSLFGWNGQRFAYLSDFIGGGVLGLQLAPGVVYSPDPEELHLVRPALGLVPDTSGRLQIRLADNLEEVTYLDSLHVVAVDHPQGTLPLPLEGLRPAPPYPRPRVILTEIAAEPLEARDAAGRSWLAEVSQVDRLYPEVVRTGRLGHAVPHELSVRFARPEGGAIWLWAHGTLEFSNSSPHLAAAQEGTSVAWPVLELRRPDGGFEVLEAAMPVPMGVDKPVLVRLPDDAGDEEGGIVLRIRTSMEIYWDRLALVRESEAPVTTTRLPAESARLQRLGYPVWTSPDGRHPRIFDYQRAQPLDTWKTIPGRYTRLGDVRDLVSQADDRLVVMAPGDEVALAFDTTGLPSVAPGRARTWLVRGVGWVKDTDLNSPGSGRVDPLPYAGMGAFPPPRSPHSGSSENARPDDTRVVPWRDPLRRLPTSPAVDP